MFSAQTRKDFATRGLVSDNLLGLLSRAKGLDLLKRDEQHEYMVDVVPMDRALPPIRHELGEYTHLDFNAPAGGVRILHHRLDQVNYPVPGYAGHDAS